MFDFSDISIFIFLFIVFITLPYVARFMVKFIDLVVEALNERRQNK